MLPFRIVRTFALFWSCIVPGGSSDGRRKAGTYHTALCSDQKVLRVVMDLKRICSGPYFRNLVSSGSQAALCQNLVVSQLNHTLSLVTVQCALLD